MSGEIIIPTDLDAIAEHNRIREVTSKGKTWKPAAITSMITYSGTSKRSTTT